MDKLCTRVHLLVIDGGVMREDSEAKHAHSSCALSLLNLILPLGTLHISRLFHTSRFCHYANGVEGADGLLTTVPATDTAGLLARHTHSPLSLVLPFPLIFG